MNKAQLKLYILDLWPRAAARQGWAVKDEAKRHQVTRQCMLLCTGPDTDSSKALGQAEISALFTYLRWLAEPENLRLNAAWEACQRDYRTRNLAAQGNYWRGKAGYAKGGRCDRDRFGGRPAGGRCGESLMTKDEAEDYLTTMRARAAAKRRKEAAAAAQGQPAKPRRKTKYDIFNEPETDTSDIPF